MRGSGRKGASVGVVVEVEGVANSAVTVGLVVGVMKRAVKCTRDLIYLKAFYASLGRDFTSRSPSATIRLVQAEVAVLAGDVVIARGSWRNQQRQRLFLTWRAKFGPS